MGEIKARGGDIETVEGEVVAGDAGDIDVISMKGNILSFYCQVENRNFIIRHIFDTSSKSCIFQNLTFNQEVHVEEHVKVVPFVAPIQIRVNHLVRKDDRDQEVLHVMVLYVQLVTNVAPAPVHAKSPVHMDDRDVQMGKFIAAISANAPCLRNVESKPSD